MVDTKEKPYHCDCGLSFARKDLLKRHRRLAHAASDEAGQSGAAIPPSEALPLPPEYHHLG